MEEDKRGCRSYRYLMKPLPCALIANSFQYSVSHNAVNEAQDIVDM